jgi:hypothetical protein
VSAGAEDAKTAHALPPVFAAQGDSLIPSAYSASPWRDDVQHGGSMLGVLARALERFPAGKPVQVTRMTVDMMRAAPLAPIETPVRMLREGRMVELLEASITCGGKEFVRATALRTRLAEIDTSALREPEGTTERFTDQEFSPPHGVVFFARCLQMQPGRGPNEGMVWYRLRTPLVAGETPSPLVRVATAADFAYGTPMLLRAKRESGYVPDRDFNIINPDTSISLLRPLEGEWVGLEGQTVLGDGGSGLAMTRVWDERGIVGHITQSVLVRDFSSSEPAKIGWRSLRKAGS